mgnify:CR=1 FL=1
MPLTFAQIGEEYEIQRIGGLPDVKKHLGDLGFVAGTKITIINSLAGNLIVRVKDIEVAIGREMAAKIFV